MAKTIVVEVYEYDGTPDEVIDMLAEAQHSDLPRFFYAADSLDTLPHPAQVEEIRQHFGE